MVALIPATLLYSQSINVIEAEMHVNGTSSLHDWQSEVTQVKVSGEIKTENGELTGISNIKVEVPVISIKSTKGSVMDNKTWDAFNHEKYPTIRFKMTNLDKLTKETYGYSMRVNGILSMAGSSKNISLKVECSNINQNVFEFSGIHKIKMTEYGMTPPTALFGTLKTGNEIKIDFLVKIQSTNS